MLCEIHLLPRQKKSFAIFYNFKKSSFSHRLQSFPCSWIHKSSLLYILKTFNGDVSYWCFLRLAGKGHKILILTHCQNPFQISMNQAFFLSIDVVPQPRPFPIQISFFSTSLFYTVFFLQSKHGHFGTTGVTHFFMTHACLFLGFRQLTHSLHLSARQPGHFLQRDLFLKPVLTRPLDLLYTKSPQRQTCGKKRNKK